jgi:hypothetical protein
MDALAPNATMGINEVVSLKEIGMTGTGNLLYGDTCIFSYFHSTRRTHLTRPALDWNWMAPSIRGNQLDLGKIACVPPRIARQQRETRDRRMSPDGEIRERRRP